MTDTAKKYEISFLLRNEEDASIVVKKLSDLGAEIANEGSVSRIQLAYPIKRETSAYFGYIHFNAEPDVIKKASDALTLEPKVLRFLIITPPIEKMVPRHSDFRYQGDQPQAPEVQKPKVEPLSNAQLEEKLEEILKN